MSKEVTMQSGYKIYIKGMVCERCILTIRNELDKLGIRIADIHLGEVTTVTTLTESDIAAIKQQISPLGFTLLEDKKAKLIQEVKMLVEQVYSGKYDFPHDFRFSSLLASSFNKDAETVSSMFSQTEGITLEKYIIGYRIEKVKELLLYSSDTLSEIAFKLGFSSVPHLSRQFKAETGLNPSHFKEISQAGSVMGSDRGLSS